MTPLDIYKQKLNKGEIQSDPAQLHAAQVLDNLYLDIVKSKSKKWYAGLLHKKSDVTRGVYIYGGVGRGKSMLMDLFFSVLPETLQKRRVHFHEFMIETHDYFHDRRQDEDFGVGIDGLLPSYACRIAETSRVLCFDEFHVTDVADAMILGRLFTALFEQGVLVVATSNWAPDDLYKGGLQRDRFLPFIELLKSHMQVVHLDSPTDYRTQFNGTGEYYLCPVNEFTDRKMDVLFKRLTQDAPAVSEVLKVKGREIEVAEAAAGVARFTFQQLCEQPHGAEDFIKIAETYHTVFLENVRKMGYDRRNEAKRFMTLIDALYENKTKVIISAAAPPERLYYGHDHAFEFERTISRLQEMQSAEYQL